MTRRLGRKGCGHSPRWALPLLLLALATCRPSRPAGGTSEGRGGGAPAPLHPGARALDEAPVGEAIPLTLIVPAEGTVVPLSFPSPQLRWTDGFQATLFRVRVRKQAAPTWHAEVWTGERILRLPPEVWEGLRREVGEGGAFEVELSAASVLPDGTLLREPTTVTSHARFSGAGEHPTGHILYSWLARPAGSPPGPTTRAYGLRLVPMRVSMQGVVERSLPEFSSASARREVTGAQEFPSPEVPSGAPGAPDDPRVRWPGLDHPIEALTSFSADLSTIERQEGIAPWSQVPEAQAYRCSGCHTSSSDGRYLVLTGDDNFGIGDQVAGDTMLFVVHTQEERFVRLVEGAISPRFHPHAPHLLTYAWTGTQMSRDFRNSIFASDIHVLDLETGQDVALPGASDPERCEASPEWSPDGRSVLFARMPAGEPCEAHRGTSQLAIVPWNEGKGGEVRLIAGTDEASANFYGRFSPDGRWIVFTRSRGGYYAKGNADLWAVPADGEAPAHRLSVSTDVQETTHAFSPDGNWIVFASNRDRVDQIRTYVARFYPDGTTAPALPAPHAGDEGVSAFNVDWVR